MLLCIPQKPLNLKKYTTKWNFLKIVMPYGLLRLQVLKCLIKFGHTLWFSSYQGKKINLCYLNGCIIYYFQNYNISMWILILKN